MKIGNKIRVQYYILGNPAYQEDHVIEEYGYCLGFFRTDQHRIARNFTPLCDLFEAGPDSEQKYLENYGEYYTNLVQAWMDIA